MESNVVFSSIGINELSALIAAKVSEAFKNSPTPTISPPVDTELLTVEEACKLLRLKSRSTLYVLLKEDRLPFIKLGKKTLFEKQELLKHLTKKSNRYERQFRK